MQIHKYLSLFCSHIDYRGYVPDGMAIDSDDYVFFENQQRIEKVAEAILDAWRYWLNINQQILLCQFPQGRVRAISIRHLGDFEFWKSYSMAIRILLTVPAVIIKACLWIFSSNFRQRNRVILDLLKKQEDFKRQCDPKSNFFQLKKFSPFDSQKENRLVNLPKDIQKSIFIFLNRKSMVPFALTCGKNYAAASKISNESSILRKDCPNFMIQPLGYERISQLQVAGLPESWKFLFDISFFHRKFHRKEMYKNVIDVKSLRILGPPDSFLSSLMQHHSIQRILMPEGSGFIIRIKDHDHYLPESTFVIARVNDEWEIFTSSLSPGLWLFLRDLSYHQEVPLVIDYLKRLFDGKPCGNFPMDLNRGVEINYETQKASEILQEGPLFCPDGITPMVQLWPNPSTQNA